MDDAYEQMEDGNYETAAEEFQQYLDSHSSKIYWKIQEVINRNDQSSYENVKKALEEGKISNACASKGTFRLIFEIKNAAGEVVCLAPYYLIVK